MTLEEFQSEVRTAVDQYLDTATNAARKFEAQIVKTSNAVLSTDIDEDILAAILEAETRRMHRIGKERGLS